MRNVGSETSLPCQPSSEVAGGLWWCVAVAAVGILFAGTTSAEERPADTRPRQVGEVRGLPDPGKDVRWDMESFAKVVRPMRHSMKGRMPLMLYSFPMPRGDVLARLRADGSLGRWIDLMARRGFVPTVEMGWQWTLPGALAIAEAVQDARQPVYLLIPRVDLLEGTAYQNCQVWATGPDASRAGQIRQWPCLPLSQPEVTAHWLRQQLQPFRDCGIRVAAVWFDDRSLPYPSKGCYEAQRSSNACRREYPPGVLDSFDSFRGWTERFRAELLSRGTLPVKETFPWALVGQHGDVISGTDVGYSLDAQMPSACANTADLPTAFRDKLLWQPDVDRFYFRKLLESVSSANAKKAPGKFSIPYLSRWLPDNQDSHYRHFAMSRDVYRELNRHLWLRGCDSLYLFNLGSPGTPVPAAFSLESVEDARAVYDELLAHREFLDRGRPLNFAVPEALDREALWSALELDGRVLVRAVSLGRPNQRVEVRRPKRPAIALDAPKEGATWLIDGDVSVKCIASGRIGSGP
jgi:hypothetical protein